MKSHIPALIRVLFTVAVISSAHAQRYDAESATRQTAARIEKNYNIALNPADYSLSQLLDIEARLGTAARIKRNFGLSYDYHTHTLSELLDIEARLSTAARIKRNFTVEYDWQTTSLSQLLQVESDLLQKARASHTPLPSRSSVVDERSRSTAPIESFPPMPHRPPAHQRYVRPTYIGADESIEEVSSNGAIITLSDGSIWKVSPLDQLDTALWLPVSDVRIVAGDDPSYPYKMINKDDGEMANVELLSR